MYQNIYNFNEISDYISSSIDIVFIGPKKDKRSTYFKDNLKNFKGKIIELSTDMSFDILNIVITDENNRVTEKNNLVLITDLRDLLKELKIDQKTVCVDITGMEHVIFFLLTQLLLIEIHPKFFLSAYTEPEEYVKEEDDFTLSKEILGYNYHSLPGYTRRNFDSEKILVTFLGFETQRFISLIEEIQDDPKIIIPVIGFPTSTPGWKLVCKKVNSRTMIRLECENNIRTCEAINPFAAFELLLNVSQEYEQQYLVIAPLGTRPHSLGAAIFTSLFRRCALIYDFPLEKEFRSNGILKCNIYNLSNYIRFNDQ